MKTNFYKKMLTIVFWMTVLVVSILFYLNSVVPYFNGTLGPRQEAGKWWFIVHFSGATCTLILGPLQFWSYFRNRFRRWHRLAGKFYIGGSVISALMVLFALQLSVTWFCTIAGAAGHHLAFYNDYSFLVCPKEEL
ncbi:MAG: DUF2306 domain-containing protein [Saprospiraceae bacterium]|nr:DUF2306 domain-containing protein [Candidatus Opimibacter skivensis]